MSKPVFSTKWFTIEEIPTSPDWNMGDEPFYRFNGPDNVITIPLTPDGRFIMVRQFRPARGNITLEFPAGLIDPGETPKQAALRELHEETGCKVEDLILLGTSGLGNNREASTYHIFAAFNVELTSSPVEEGIEVLSVSPQEIMDSTKQGELDLLATAGVLFIAKAKLGDRLPDFW